MIDSAVRAVHNLLTDRFQPTLEQLAFRLGELRGLSLCRPWARVLGLRAEEVGAAEQAALAALLQAERVRRGVVQAGMHYRAFCTWLLTLLRRLQEDSHDTLVGYPRSQMDAVGVFVRTQYLHDAVGPQLWGPGGPAAAAAVAGEEMLAADAEGEGEGAFSSHGGMGSATDTWGLVDEVLARLRRSTLGGTAGPDRSGSSSGSRGPTGSGGGSSGTPPSIQQQLRWLQSAVAAALRRTCETISPTLTVESSIQLCCPAAEEGGAEAEGGACVCATPSALAYQRDAAGPAVCISCGDQVMLIRSSGGGSGGGGSSNDAPPGREGALLQLPAGARAVDVTFYKQGQLVLLLARPGEATLAMLPQDQLHFAPLPADLAPAGEGALEACRRLLGAASAVTLLPEGIRQRRMPYDHVQRPLAVSASRGVGCVLAEPQVRWNG